MSIRIVTDSSCDLPAEAIARHGIRVVPLYINIGTDSYLDNVEMSRQEFYEGLPHFSEHPTTAVPGTAMFVEAYEQLAAEGATAVLSIHISETLSAITAVARQAAAQTSSVPVTVLHSGNLTLGTGLLVLAAATAAEEGNTLSQILSLLGDQVSRTHCFAALDTLEFLRRSGRLGRFQTSLGSLLRLKPVLKMHNSEIDMERVRTRKRAVARVIELVTELGPLDQLALVHTHAPEEAEALRQQAQHLFRPGETPLSAEVTPVIGAHIGPGAVGFVCVAAGER